MAEKKLVIFDMDGTLLDSMPYWNRLGRTYLEGKNKVVPDDFEASIEGMTIRESAQFMKDTFELEDSVEAIIEDSLFEIKIAYQFEIPAKRGMKQVLKKEKESGKMVVLLTSSDAFFAKAALKRTGMLSYFDSIYTADEIGVGKNKAESFKIVCQKQGVLPKQAHCYEDALYAIVAAKQAGCYVTAVYDATMEQQWDKIKDLSAEQIKTNPY